MPDTPKYGLTVDNIKPIHNDLQNTGSNTTFTSLVSFRQADPQGYTDIQNTGNNTTFTSLKTSGFQYITNGGFSFQTEPITLLDSGFINYTVYQDEVINLYEGTNLGHTIITEPLNLLDETVVNIKIFAEEVFPMADELAKISIFEEIFTMLDEGFTKVTKTFTEVLNLAESTDPFLFFDVVDGSTLEVLATFQADDTTAQEVTIIDQALDSTALCVKPYNLVAVTGASAIENPFEPTIILGGVTYISNPSTEPDPSYVVTPETYYVQWLNAGIGGATACDVYNFNFSLDYSGGSFSITSELPLGNLGDVITIFGLRGTITEFGREVSHSYVGYRTSGIFGNPNLNKQLQFLVYGNQYFLKLLSSQNLTGAPADSWQTVKAAAYAIAQVAGISLAWTVADAPLTDLFAQASSTGYEALSSLAGMVGGTLRWNGNNHYTVSYPTQSAGTWYVPNNHLINESGIAYGNILDLEYGVSGTGAIAMQVYDTFDSTQRELPGGTDPTQSDGITAQSGGAAVPDIVTIASTSKPFTAEDPPLIKEMPLDTTDLYIQILVTPEAFNADLGGANSGSTGQTGARYVTTNEDIWYNLGNFSAIGSNPYFIKKSIGGQTKICMRADYTLFPQLSSINNGNFVMSFGVKRQDLSADYLKAQEDAAQAQKNLLARTQDAFRFVKTYDGTINSYFFGSIPLPGMYGGSGLICSNTVEGVIESVTFSSPGVISVQVARYKKINFIHNKLSI